VSWVMKLRSLSRSRWSAVFFSALFVADPRVAAAQCCGDCNCYRLQCETVYEERQVTCYRTECETVYDERQVVRRTPVWETEQRERRFTVLKPVTETSIREERYTVQRPV